jgi:hypothetical protein
MTRVKKPCGLIGYRTLDHSPMRIWKFKSVAYFCLIVAAVGTLFFSLKSREPVDIAVLRAIEAPYSEVKNSVGQTEIINHFRLHLTSQTDKDIPYEIHLAGEKIDGLEMTVVPNPLTVKAGSSETWHVFVKTLQMKEREHPKFDFDIEIKSPEGFITSRTLTFVGPVQ